MENTPILRNNAMFDLIAITTIWGLSVDSSNRNDRPHFYVMMTGVGISMYIFFYMTLLYE